MSKKNIKNYTLQDLKTELSQAGFEKFRANQVFRWLYKKKRETFQDFKNLSKNLIDYLIDNFEIISLVPENIQYSKIDATVKYTLKLLDGEIIESVIIPDRERRTLCVSSQAGCKMGCEFCYTGSGGWRRDLEPWEIVEQVIIAMIFLEKESLKLTNIVFMGMGEPLDNFDNVVKALKIIVNKEGLEISPRRISVSTVGITDKIARLIEETAVNLSVSINAPNNLVRSSIMPVNGKYPLNELVDFIAGLNIPKRKRVVVEYVLLHGVNDSTDDALQLAKLLRGFPVKVNLIPFNGFPGSRFVSPDESDMLQFQDTLIDKGYSVFIRSSKGKDILAACGQLRGTVLNKFK